QRGEVLEYDPRLGEVRDVADAGEDELPNRPATHRQRFDFGVRRGWLRGPLLAHLCTWRADVVARPDVAPASSTVSLTTSSCGSSSCRFCGSSARASAPVALLAGAPAGTVSRAW